MDHITRSRSRSRDPVPRATARERTRDPLLDIVVETSTETSNPQCASSVVRRSRWGPPLQYPSSIASVLFHPRAVPLIAPGNFLFLPLVSHPSPQKLTSLITATTSISELKQLFSHYRLSFNALHYAAICTTCARIGRQDIAATPLLLEAATRWASFSSGAFGRGARQAANIIYCFGALKEKAPVFFEILRIAETLLPEFNVSLCATRNTTANANEHVRITSCPSQTSCRCKKL